ncbi:MAG: YtxH domain-containing protein [Saprospiraceae bacterium]|nr:YtxH domain-containing protein [Saprospiraceae bacterium]
MSSVKVVLGVLAGVAIGAAAGILLAPHKGSETRKNISNRSDAYAQKLNNQFKSFVDSLSGKFETMTQEVDVMVENGAGKMARGIDHATGTKRV